MATAFLAVAFLHFMKKVIKNHYNNINKSILGLLLLSIIFCFAVRDTAAFSNYNASDLENCSRLAADSNSSGGFVYGFNGKTLYSSMLVPDHYNRYMNVPYNIKSVCQSGELSCAMYICDNKLNRYGISAMNMNNGSTVDYFFEGVNDASSKMFSLSGNYAYFVRSDAVYSYVAVYGIDGNLKKKCSFSDNIFLLFNNNSITYAMLYDGQIYCFHGSGYTKVAKLDKGENAFNAGAGYICTESGMLVSLKSGETEYVTNHSKNCVVSANGGIYTVNDSRLVFFEKNASERFIDLSKPIRCVVACNGRVATLNYSYDYNDINASELSSDSDSQVDRFTDSYSNKQGGSNKKNIQKSGECQILNGEYIIESAPSITVAGLKKKFPYSVTVYNNDGNVVTSGNIRTGYTVKTDNAKYTIIILGDLTGEGNLKSNDISTMMKYCVDAVSFNELQTIAADYDCNGVIDNRDLVLMARSIN